LNRGPVIDTIQVMLFVVSYRSSFFKNACISVDLKFEMLFDAK